MSADTETIGSGSAPAEPVASSGAVDPVVSPFAAGSVVSPFANDLPVIEITEAALETVLSIRAGEDNPDELGLRIEITGSRGSEYTYDLSFDEISNAVADDQLIEASGVTVIVPPSCTSTFTWSPAFRCANSMSAASNIRPCELPILVIVLTMTSNYVLQAECQAAGSWRRPGTSSAMGRVRCQRALLSVIRKMSKSNCV